MRLYFPTGEPPESHRSPTGGPYNPTGNVFFPPESHRNFRIFTVGIEEVTVGLYFPTGVSPESHRKYNLPTGNIFFPPESHRRATGTFDIYGRNRGSDGRIIFSHRRLTGEPPEILSSYGKFL